MQGFILSWYPFLFEELCNILSQIFHFLFLLELPQKHIKNTSNKTDKD